ncbi:nucleotide-diphospho-sugar transferase [Patiriisocius hiemis]|uniref:Nucleotide-diphospho-sugar transferase n=1 Tax=Patiriisocius hiemis TaxID=3075604 RepID=A0ABU2YFN1_9FLAO|nr:nucleotide-diphospho-sugar transferase [Constantimarinum sp. W242]MDT0556030.1 nucleotide-diphospho-sugar transferase [Constantimarinum sp. W242]
MTTPILYLVFNRLFETKKSFEVLKIVKPKKLYIAADGPRLARYGEEEKCQKVRDYLLKNINWDCEIKTLFRDKNLGCRKAVEGALDWFFEEEEMGVILEDDIVPDVSFFDYATKLLDEYRDDDTIFSINGCNFGYESSTYSYGLTRYFNMWGWATWRKSHELVKKNWDEIDIKADFSHGSSLLKSLKLKTIWPLDEWYSLWRNHFKNTLNDKIDTWDYQWAYTCLKAEKFSIRPNVNLINNIGFNENATHTKKMEDFSPNTLKISSITVRIIPKSKLTTNSNYEIRFVAEKWQHLKINYTLLLKKISKKLSS